jgi:hypothetical protein
LPVNLNALHCKKGILLEKTGEEPDSRRIGKPDAS